MAAVEETHQDILQNIEAAIVSVHRNRPDVLDYDVEGALEALVAHYSAEARGRTAREPVLQGARHEVFGAVQGICEWRLGRDPSDPDPVGDGVPGVEVIVACLKRVRASVQRHTREGGRQGYLTFIRRFVL